MRVAWLCLCMVGSMLLKILYIQIGFVREHMYVILAYH